MEKTQLNSDLVQKQLSALTQKIVHVIQASKEEKDILDKEFDSLKNGILFMDGRLQIEKVRILSEVHGIGSMIQLQPTILEEMQSGIQIPQQEDTDIVVEATELSAVIRQELDAQRKKITNSQLQSFAVKTYMQAA